MAGGYKNVIAIPVDAPDVKAIAGALFKPEGAGPFPAVVYMRGCDGLDAAGPSRCRRPSSTTRARKGFAVLIVDPLTPRGPTEGLRQVAHYSSLLSRRRRRLCGGESSRGSSRHRREPDLPAGLFVRRNCGIGRGKPAARSHAEAFAGVVAYYPYCFVGMRFGAPTLILIGEKDAFASSSLCERQKVQPNLEVVVYPGATHAFAMPGLTATSWGAVSSTTRRAEAPRRAPTHSWRRT